VILVDLERVTARRPDRPLFESLSLTISSEDRLGVVGVNGTGKSTLLRVLAGLALAVLAYEGNALRSAITQHRTVATQSGSEAAVTPLIHILPPAYTGLKPTAAVDPEQLRAIEGSVLVLSIDASGRSVSVVAPEGEVVGHGVRG